MAELQACSPPCASQPPSSSHESSNTFHNHYNRTILTTFHAFLTMSTAANNNPNCTSNFSTILAFSSHHKPPLQLLIQHMQSHQMNHHQLAAVTSFDLYKSRHHERPKLYPKVPSSPFSPHSFTPSSPMPP